MKKLLLLLFYANCINAQSPGFTLMKKYNGIEVYEKTSLINSDEKKNYYVIEIEYVNTTDHDLFYKAYKSGTGKKAEIFEYFAFVTSENVAAISFVNDTYANLIGDQTNLKSINDEKIFVLKKGKLYSRKLNFRGKKGIEPALSFSTIDVVFKTNLYDFL